MRKLLGRKREMSLTPLVPERQAPAGKSGSRPDTSAPAPGVGRGARVLTRNGLAAEVRRTQREAAIWLPMGMR